MRKRPVLVFPQMGETKKVKCLRPFLTTFLPVLGRITTEFQQARFCGCSSRLNLCIHSTSFTQNCSASVFSWKPTTMSSAKRTTITSPCAHFFRHEWTHKSRHRVGTHSPTAAMRFPLAGVPSTMSISFPFSSTPAFSHFWMSRRTRRSAIRCCRNFTSHSWEIPSKKLLMSTSSTQFTCFRLIPAYSASRA